MFAWTQSYFHDALLTVFSCDFSVTKNGGRILVSDELQKAQRIRREFGDSGEVLLSGLLYIFVALQNEESTGGGDLQLFYDGRRRCISVVLRQHAIVSCPSMLIGRI